MVIPTNLISIVLIPLLSLSGLLAGMVLSFIAQEEVAAGKKYFIMMYRIIFVLLSGIIAYFLYVVSFNALVIFSFFAIVLLVLDLKKPSSYALYAHYLFFLVGYFLSSKPLIVAAILFLYGLPVGTLLRVKE